jgi:hypothetical protein
VYSGSVVENYLTVFGRVDTTDAVSGSLRLIGNYGYLFTDYSVNER